MDENKKPSQVVGATGEENISDKTQVNEKCIRIKLSNIRINDSYEQMKFNQMLIDRPDKAISQIETLLEQMVIEISFD